MSDKEDTFSCALKTAPTMTVRALAATDDMPAALFIAINHPGSPQKKIYVRGAKALRRVATLAAELASEAEANGEH